MSQFSQGPEPPNQASSFSWHRFKRLFIGLTAALGILAALAQFLYFFESSLHRALQPQTNRISPSMKRISPSEQRASLERQRRQQLRRRRASSSVERPDSSLARERKILIQKQQELEKVITHKTKEGRPATEIRSLKGLLRRVDAEIGRLDREGASQGDGPTRASQGDGATSGGTTGSSSGTSSSGNTTGASTGDRKRRARIRKSRKLQPFSHPKPTPPSLDAEAIIANARKKFKAGKIVYKVADQMETGQSVPVEARVGSTSSASAPALRDGFSAPGRIVSEDLLVSTFMSAQLTGDKHDFQIQPLAGAEEQVVLDDQPAKWTWSVTPLRSGKYLLLLTVSPRITIPGHGWTSLPSLDFRRQITVTVQPVTVQPVDVAKAFFSKNWQYMLTTLLGSGVLGALAGWFRVRKKKGPARKEKQQPKRKKAA
jgi:hypothetical protein